LIGTVLAEGRIGLEFRDGYSLPVGTDCRLFRIDLANRQLVCPDGSRHRFEDVYLPFQPTAIRIQELAQGAAPGFTPVGVAGAPGALAPAVQPASKLENAQGPCPDLTAWFKTWEPQHPLHSEAEVIAAAKATFSKKRITRQMIRNLRKPPDGTPSRKGKKPGKSDAEHHRRMRTHS
jgi:hypothetical protein